MSSMIRSKDMGPGKPIGSITTDFDEIDGILNDTWRGITHGIDDDLDEIVEQFMNNMINTFIRDLNLKSPS